MSKDQTWWESLITCQSCHNSNLNTNGDFYKCPKCGTYFQLNTIMGNLEEVTPYEKDNE